MAAPKQPVLLGGQMMSGGAPGSQLDTRSTQCGVHSSPKGPSLGGSVGQVGNGGSPQGVASSGQVPVGSVIGQPQNQQAGTCTSVGMGPGIYGGNGFCGGGLQQGNGGMLGMGQHQMQGSFQTSPMHAQMQTGQMQSNQMQSGTMSPMHSAQFQTNTVGPGSMGPAGMNQSSIMQSGGMQTSGMHSGGIQRSSSYDSRYGQHMQHSSMMPQNSMLHQGSMQPNMRLSAGSMHQGYGGQSGGMLPSSMMHPGGNCGGSNLPRGLQQMNLQGGLPNGGLRPGLIRSPGLQHGMIQQNPMHQNLLQQSVDQLLASAGQHSQGLGGGGGGLFGGGHQGNVNNGNLGGGCLGQLPGCGVLGGLGSNSFQNVIGAHGNNGSGYMPTAGVCVSPSLLGSGRGGGEGAKAPPTMKPPPPPPPPPTPPPPTQPPPPPPETTTEPSQATRAAASGTHSANEASATVTADKAVEFNARLEEFRKMWPAVEEPPDLWTWSLAELEEFYESGGIKRPKSDAKPSSPKKRKAHEAFEFSVQEALQLQGELHSAFSDGQFQDALKRLQHRYPSRRAKGHKDGRAYFEAFEALALSAFARVLPNWELTADWDGVRETQAKMQDALMHPKVKRKQEEINVLMGLPRDATFKPPEKTEEMFVYRSAGDGPVPGYPRALLTDEDGDEGHEFLVEDRETGELRVSGESALEAVLGYQDCWYTVVHKPAIVIRARPDVTSDMVGRKKAGKKLRVQRVVEGKWLQLHNTELVRLGAQEAWVLFEGTEQGLPGRLLLERVV